jgi:hypothetical protein
MSMANLNHIISSRVAQGSGQEMAASFATIIASLAVHDDFVWTYATVCLDRLSELALRILARHNDVNLKHQSYSQVWSGVPATTDGLACPPSFDAIRILPIRDFQQA